MKIKHVKFHLLFDNNILFDNKSFYCCWQSKPLKYLQWNCPKLFPAWRSRTTSWKSSRSTSILSWSKRHQWWRHVAKFGLVRENNRDCAQNKTTFCWLNSLQINFPYGFCSTWQYSSPGEIPSPSMNSVESFDCSDNQFNPAIAGLMQVHRRIRTGDI